MSNFGCHVSSTLIAIKWGTDLFFFKCTAVRVSVGKSTKELYNACS